jgi:chemotaxis protein MotB
MYQITEKGLMEGMQYKYDLQQKENVMRIKMSVMLCAVLLATGCVSQQKYNTEVEQVDTLTSQNQLYQKLNQQLSAEVKTDQVQIQQLQNQLKVTMVNEILFPEGGWTLDAKGKKILEKIVPTLSSLQGQQIVVEGFTDNVPIGPELRKRFPSNWELSSGRADDVLRFLAANEISGPDLSVDTSIEPGGE